jgi:hypothetical protein
VKLEGEERTVELDLGVAESLRIDAGPGLALEAGERSTCIVRVGGWLGATRVVVTSIVADSGAGFLAGALYDVRRGALLREGRVRIASGSVPSVQMGALASFLLTGQPSPDVTAVSTVPLDVVAPASGALDGLAAPPVQTPHPKPRWLRPAAYAAGAVAIGLAGFATWQGLSARSGYRDANAMLRADGTLLAGVDQATYDRTVDGANTSKRNAYIGAAGAVAFAVAAGVLGYLSWDDQGRPVVRF